MRDVVALRWGSAAPAPPAPASPAAPASSAPARSGSVTSTRPPSFAEVSGALVEASFSRQDLPDSLSDSQFYRVVASNTGALGIAIPFVVPFRGSLVAMTFAASANKTAGTCILSTFIDGDKAGGLSWTNGEAGGSSLFPVNEYSFSSGAQIDVRALTDGSFAPSGSLDVEVIVYLAQTNSTDN